jgi:hypothetical protein
MYRFALAVILSTQAAAALAAGVCSVSGTAFDADGRPVRDAVVRLTDLQTRQVAYSVADANAAFVFNGLESNGSGRYRIELISAPTVVTGTKIPTRSIVGTTREFGCISGARQDVRAQVY